MKIKEKILIDLNHRKNAIFTEIAFLKDNSTVKGLVEESELRGRLMAINEIISFVEEL